MKIKLTSKELREAVNEHFRRQGLLVTAMTLTRPWLGDSVVEVEAMQHEATLPTARVRQTSLAGEAAENGARAAYDLACRLYSANMPLVAWHDLSEDNKRTWLVEANLISAATRGSDK